MGQFTVFDYAFDDEELQQEFEEFFMMNNLYPLFTNEHHSPSVRVSWADARNVVNGGSYAKMLESIADDIHSSTSNKKYEEEMFMILYKSNSVRGMALNHAKISDYLIHITDPSKDLEGKYEKNKWNIVFYNDDLP